MTTDGIEQGVGVAAIETGVVESLFAGGLAVDMPFTGQRDEALQTGPVGAVGEPVDVPRAVERSDFDPADIHQDNPAEELNLFAEPGRFYGYPYCWSEFSLPPGQGMGPGTQWADPNFIDDGTHTDQWCRDPDNVVAPVLAMQGHSAPLDVLFYAGGSFPGDYVGDAFVTFHGSWNRDDPTGYKVIRIPFGADGTPNGDPQPLLEYAGDGDFAADWPHRPVGLATLPSGVLLVTSDSSGSVLAIGYAP